MSLAATSSGTALTLTRVFGALFLPKNNLRKTLLSKSLFTNLRLPFSTRNKVTILFENRTLK